MHIILTSQTEQTVPQPVAYRLYACSVCDTKAPLQYAGCGTI